VSDLGETAAPDAPESLVEFVETPDHPTQKADLGD